jgi:hypothetical protein
MRKVRQNEKKTLSLNIERRMRNIEKNTIEDYKDLS